MVKLTRHLNIAEKIVFVDGLSGTGKSILGPVISSFKSVEKQRLEHIYEYLCLLNHFKMIEPDAAVSLMRLYADLALYNSMISREVNLRLSDDTGLLNNPDSLKYIARLFYKDGNSPLDRIRREKPVLQIVTHQVLPISDLAFDAYGDHLRIVEMTRHPLFMIDHWYNYIERYGKDSREFTLNLSDGNESVPWFAYGWEKKYKSLNSMDRVIHSIKWLSDRTNTFYEKLNSEEKERVLFISFENFVFDPWSFPGTPPASL